MYQLDMTCPKCGKIFKVGESVTFIGLCPYDGEALKLEFRTIGYNNAPTGN